MSNLKNPCGEVTVTAPGAGPATGGRSSWERNSMRRSILNAVGLAQIAGVLVCRSAFPQGTLLLRNFGDGLNAPIYDLNGEPLSPLPNYRVALYGGGIESLAPLGYASLVSPGYFGTPEPITVPYTALDLLQIRVWDSNDGATYEEVALSGSRKLGHSELFRAPYPLGDPSKDPPVPAPELLGLKSFTFPVVNPSIKVNAPTIGTNGFTFAVTGPGNAPLEIQATTNLASQSWVPLLTGTLTNGSYTYTEAQWTNSPARFYRVKLW